MTESENLKFIEKNYLTIPVKTLAQKLGRSQTYVRKRLKDNNWIIPEEIIEQRKRDSYYKKGRQPENKGKKQTDYMSQEAIERTKVTRFKKGQKPHNTKEGVGHIVTKIDNTGIPYKYIKIADAEWRSLSRVVWEKHNGKLNTNDIITFKDGNSLNCKIENLEKITRAEHAHRNSYNRTDKWTKHMAKRAILTQIRKNNELKQP